MLDKEKVYSSSHVMNSNLKAIGKNEPPQRAKLLIGHPNEPLIGSKMFQDVPQTNRVAGLKLNHSPVATGLNYLPNHPGCV